VVISTRIFLSLPKRHSKSKRIRDIERRSNGGNHTRKPSQTGIARSIRIREKNPRGFPFTNWKASSPLLAMLKGMLHLMRKLAKTF
jgi:hypothetical protein